MTAYMTAEKNKVASSTATLMLLEITFPGGGDPARIVNNNEDITWRGHTWQALPFELDEIGDSSKGEVPRVDVRINNINREMRYYIELYDIYTKTNGFSPVTVDIFVVNSGNLANATPEVEYNFELKAPQSGVKTATFTLGASSPYSQRFPLDRIMKNFGRVRKFKDAMCGYVGIGFTSCNRTLANCRERGMSGRYCGFPGAGNTALRV